MGVEHESMTARGRRGGRRSVRERGEEGEQRRTEQEIVRGAKGGGWGRGTEGGTEGRFL